MLLQNSATFLVIAKLSCFTCLTSSPIFPLISHGDPKKKCPFALSAPLKLTSGYLFSRVQSFHTSGISPLKHELRF
jgi:hypothetical protein